MRDVSSWPQAEQIKYFAAREAFRHRSEVCPHSVEIDGQQVRITWARWFERRFGVSLDDYERSLEARR
jgi:hypothetical protein